MSQTRPFDKFLESRRGQLDQVAGMGVQLHRVSGTVLVKGAGEALHDVQFPVAFIEKPGVSFGADYESGTLTTGSLPTVSVVFTSWLTQGVTDRINSGYWIGGTMAIVVTGTTDQSIWVHWHVEGRAYRNPITP